MSLTSLMFEDQQFVYRLADSVTEAGSILSLLSQALHRDFSYREYEWFKLKHPFFPSRTYAAYEKSTNRLAATMCMRPFRYRICGKDHVAPVRQHGLPHCRQS